MKLTALFTLLLFVFVGCVQHNDAEITIGDNVEVGIITIDYAKGFEVEYHDGFIKIITKSIASNSPFRDSVFILTSDTIAIDPTLKTISFGGNKLACQSSTQLAYLNQLGSLDDVCALCGMGYIVDTSVINTLVKNKVQEICLAGAVQSEGLLVANPSLFFTSPFRMEEQDKYKSKGINTLLIGEYLEETQLARLEWIKIIGLIVGKVKEANDYFYAIEKEYLALKKDVKKRNKTFFMNLPFNEQWFMPSTNSVGVELIEDAGLSYFFNTDQGTENTIHSKEEVWEVGIDADYWIIIAERPKGYGMADLLKEEEVYKEFKAVKNKQVIFCNTATKDYFAKGVIEPNIILSDLLFALDQISNHEPQYFFRLE